MIRPLHARTTGAPAAPTAVLLALFFASGATSLVYEVIWARQLHLVVGTSQIAVACVLAAFMGGLAAGSFVAARVGIRIRRPLLAYAGIEATIGLYALLFPTIVHALEPIYLWVAMTFDPTPWATAAGSLALLFVAMLPPTLCMGATLPLLMRVVADDERRLGGHVGRLYGTNTLGAVFGTGSAGFLLLPVLGLASTNRLAAVVNFAVALAAVMLARRRSLPDGAGGIEPTSADTRGGSVAFAQTHGRHVTVTVVMGVAGLAGLGSLLHEVAWFRLLTLMFGGSAYSFSLMLMAFLLGIGLGGWSGGLLADRVFVRWGRGTVLSSLALAQVCVAGLSWVAMHLFHELPWAVTNLVWWLRDSREWMGAVGIDDPFLLLWPGKLLLALAVMLPATFFMGATFPLLVRSITDRSAAATAIVGRVYGWNTVGAILGVVGGSLVLLPTLHVRGTIQLAISLHLGAGLLMAVLAFRTTRGATRAVTGALVALTGLGIGVLPLSPPRWEPLLMTCGAYHYASDATLTSRTRRAFDDYFVAPFELLYYDEGLSSVVTVARARDGANTWLAVDGKVDASLEDMDTQVLLAHLPALLHSHPTRALVIGFASGITTGVMARYPFLQEIDVVELESAVIGASRFFDAESGKPLDDPRVSIRINDARNHLARVVHAGAARYDLISSEPSNPWLSGAANLFTREFFAMGKLALAPGGIWAQWIQTYGLGGTDLKSLLATFSDLYRHVALFRVDASDLIVLGSDAPIEIRATRIARAFESFPMIAKALRSAGLETPEEILSLYHTDRPGLRALCGGVERNTDDNMRIEYRAPLFLQRATEEDNDALLTSVARIPWTAVEGRKGLLRLARGYMEHDVGWERAERVLERASALYPDDPSVHFERWELERRRSSQGGPAS